MEINKKTLQDYAKILRDATPYNDDIVGIRYIEKSDKRRKDTIRKYYKEKAGLDLEAMEQSSLPTWEKALKLAQFVAKLVPHDNQKKWIKNLNAISLYEYAKEYPTGFNCRWHSILLSELLLSAGIKNTFITCLPEDKNDGDCHVVNHVWLPEKQKWAMIDSDMTEYATTKEGEVLSLFEMRELLCDGGDFEICALPGFEDAWYGSPEGKEYLKCYWAKNLYWFARHTTYGLSLESKWRFGDSYVCLIPPGYDYKKDVKCKEITNVQEFWG